MQICPDCQARTEADAAFCTECGKKLNRGNSAETANLQTIGGLETVDTQARRPGVDAATPVLEPGVMFAGRYKIETVIGRGGMGVVYRAEDCLARKPVALKLIRPERLAGAGAVERLIAEGITARDIRHTNVVAVYDAGTDSGQPYISMEYLPGQSLRSWHRQKIQDRKDIPARVAARIVAEILDGLKAAHDGKVIHRDLKPENIILMSEPGEAAAPLKILDFGIARAANVANDNSSSTGLGTPSYMAPEQATNPDTAGPPADLYSLSVIFYELLVDVLPRGHWQPPSGGRSDVPAGIDALIEAGLSNRPASRPQTTVEYRKQLVDAINLTSVIPKKPPHAVQRAIPDVTPPTQSPLARYGLFGGLGLAGLIAISAITSSGSGNEKEPVDPCAGLSGAAYNACAGIELDDGGKIKPVEPDSGYARLSGNWDTDMGLIYAMNVSQDGSFSGSGYQSDGLRYDLQGRFQGSTASYTVAVPAFNTIQNGDMVWDGQCHISFATRDQWGTIVLQGQMHVNHIPGRDCP